LPIFRFNKAFPLVRGVKTFLHLKDGRTRGVAPDVERYVEQTEKLRNARQLVREQRKSLKSKDKEIKDLAKNLKRQRRRNHKHKRKLWQQRSEIFQLKGELAATKESLENAQNVSLAPRASGAPGAPKAGALPDFVVIGAQKCGTSFFYGLLTRHPSVERAAVKEVHYFDQQENFAKGIEWYRRNFPTPRREDGQRTITGEASPSYLISRHAPERMAEVVPDVRLIALLRNPVDRAYSHYHMAARNGNETRSFEEAVDEGWAWLLDGGNETSEHAHPSDVDRSRSVSYLRRGIYVDQLQRWRQFFSDEQMLVLKSEDFFKRPQESMKLVQEFLDLPYREPELPPRKAKNRYEPMAPAARRRLEEFFEPHNRRLYEYLGVDFGW
jgi:hypothetical protein